MCLLVVYPIIKHVVNNLVAMSVASKCGCLGGVWKLLQRRRGAASRLLFGDAFRVQGRSDFLASSIILIPEGIVKVSLP